MQYLILTKHGNINTNGKLVNTSKNITETITSSDEVRVYRYLHDEVHIVLKHMAEKHPKIKELVKKYLQKLDPSLHILYRKRKDYEDSINLINRTIGNILEDRNLAIQKMLPHYFQKFKTDGYEFELFVGQSLLKQDKFEELHLRNLRLWQLTTLAEIARANIRLQTELSCPMMTAQILLVYNSEIRIKFRTDEKCFDVEGLDLALGLARSGHKVALYRSLLERFAQGQADFAAELATACSSQDRTGAVRLAHTLKSVAAQIGAEPLAELAGQLEEALQRGDDDSTQQQHVDSALQRLLDRIPALLEAWQATPEPSAPPCAPPPEALMQALRTMLQDDDFACTEFIDQNAAVLRAGLGPRYDKLLAAVHRFDFDTALAILATSAEAPAEHASTPG